jgi:lysyl-tRNA synthetase class 2
MTNWQRIKQDPSLMEKFLMREKVVDGIREFFKNEGFHEVETPLLVKYPGTEPFLEVFETEMKLASGRKERGFLLTSPEFGMKKLLAGGMSKIFQVCKSFRNSEGLSPKHNPEFTILEWYRTDSDYQQIMSDCEDLVCHLVKNLKHGGAEKDAPEDNDDDLILEYQGKKYDVSPGWPKFSVAEAFEKWVGLDADRLLDRDEVVSSSPGRGLPSRRKYHLGRSLQSVVFESD